MRSIMIIWVLVAIVTLTGCNSVRTDEFAEEVGQLKAQNTELEERIDVLEQRVDALETSRQVQAPTPDEADVLPSIEELAAIGLPRDAMAFELTRGAENTWEFKVEGQPGFEITLDENVHVRQINDLVVSVIAPLHSPNFWFVYRYRRLEMWRLVNMTPQGVIDASLTLDNGELKDRLMRLGK